MRGGGRYLRVRGASAPVKTQKRKKFMRHRTGKKMLLEVGTQSWLLVGFCPLEKASLVEAVFSLTLCHLS